LYYTKGIKETIWDGEPLEYVEDMEITNDFEGFRNNERLKLRFTGYTLRRKLLNNFYGELTYELRNGAVIKEYGIFSDKALLNGVGKRIYKDFSASIGDFCAGRLDGDALKDYEIDNGENYGGFGTFKDESFIEQNERMT